MNQHKPKHDPILMVIGTAGAGGAVFLFLCLLYLFVSIVFLGGGSVCPENFCR